MIKGTPIILMLVIVALFFAFLPSTNNKKDTDEALADKTFNEIISGIQTKDISKLVNIFSFGEQKKDVLTQQATELVDFIHGQIIAFSSASEAGVGSDYEIEKGKGRKYIQSSFCVSTTESKYYIAIKECVADDSVSENIGVVSLYIIEANAWTEDFVYRGDGAWTYGINIHSTD